jgi:hypothetical protein
MDIPSGMPALRFDGQADYLRLNSPVTGQSVFIVMRNTSGAAQHRTLLADDGYTYMSGWDRQIWHTGNTAAVRDGQTWLNGAPVQDYRYVYYPPADGPLAVLTSIATSPVTTTHIGAYAGIRYFWLGDIAEILIYDRALPPAEGDAVGVYLSKRHKIVSPRWNPQQ